MTLQIRILEADKNRRGDLFGRLVADLFIALGYDQPRLNIHKSGREIDLQADHRLEPRRAIGECKATKTPIGGDDVNKFMGAVDVESKDPRPISAYFVSLSGFTETAIEQELSRPKPAILLDAPRILSELIKGRIIVPPIRACEAAGRLVPAEGTQLEDNFDLLAHERGWIWTVYYGTAKERTHVALVHSDGTPLSARLAAAIIQDDRTLGGSLHALSCLNRDPPPSRDELLPAALAAYRSYIDNECGHIQLDGLPADSDVGSRRLRLEHLFVPLHVDLLIQRGGEMVRQERRSVGTVLESRNRIALLAPPGGGKSTLLKRLATAYADPARRSQSTDVLPDRPWLPLFFRCRELRGLARASFGELLDALSQREPVRLHSIVFRQHIDRMLSDGAVLLLVDGLDEIPDPGDRAAFICTIRAALQAYPGIAAVITSREAGFRHVAAHIAPICTQATISPFNAEDITRLSVSWHREVVGDTEKVRTDAMALATTISNNDRIQRLATNPLLLTTLLLVKRWVGSLPTRRAVLYGKAVEVLLMTWNTEGHEPIPEEEALPQLCYVASAMMSSGIERISRPRLAGLLREARLALPSELGYVKGTVEEFIHRVEDRSSLLSMTGTDVEDGQLVEFFEFRHLTFQEFLTARGLVEGWHRGRRDGDTLVSVLEPHFEEDKWREVIPLASLLGGKSTEPLLQRLTTGLEELNQRTHGRPRERGRRTSIVAALASCLADEAPARPETIRAAARALLPWGEAGVTDGAISGVARSRYGPDLREEARTAFVNARPDQEIYYEALVETIWAQSVGVATPETILSAAEKFAEWTASDSMASRCEGALGQLYLAFRVREELDIDLPADVEGKVKACIALTGDRAARMVLSDCFAESFAGMFATVWIGATRAWQPSSEIDLMSALFDIWQRSESMEARRIARWAIGRLPLLPRDSGWAQSVVLGEPLRERLSTTGGEKTDDDIPLVILSWYTRWLDDDALTKRVFSLVHAEHRAKDTRTTGQTIRDLAIRLGIEVPPAKN